MKTNEANETEILTISTVHGQWPGKVDAMVRFDGSTYTERVCLPSSVYDADGSVNSDRVTDAVVSHFE